MEGDDFIRVCDSEGGGANELEVPPHQFKFSHGLVTSQPLSNGPVTASARWHCRHAARRIRLPVTHGSPCSLPRSAATRPGPRFARAGRGGRKICRLGSHSAAVRAYPRGPAERRLPLAVQVPGRPNCLFVHRRRAGHLAGKWRPIIILASIYP